MSKSNKKLHAVAALSVAVSFSPLALLAQTPGPSAPAMTPNTSMTASGPVPEATNTATTEQPTEMPAASPASTATTETRSDREEHHDYSWIGLLGLLGLAGLLRKGHTHQDVVVDRSDRTDRPDIRR